MFSATAPASVTKCDDIGERLPRLRHEIVALEFLLGIPADLARKKNDMTFGRDVVGLAARAFPVRRVEKRQCHYHPLFGRARPQTEALYFARLRFRKSIDEFYGARVLKWSDCRLDAVLQAFDGIECSPKTPSWSTT